MVLNRNEKKKRKEGDLVDLMGPLSESPKRTKIHAQRKFAQGANTVFNPSHTPVKDKEKTKPSTVTELITHKRPNTEDFVTFLCYRASSMLPPSFNFFNIGTKKEKQEHRSVRTSVDKIASPCAGVSTEIQKQDTCQKNMTKLKPVIPVKKKVPSTIHKNIKLKTATSTVQALKKKYQEQRLAKQRIKNKLKTTCVMRTRSCTERVILNAGIQPAQRKFLPRHKDVVETKRRGLRSGVLADKTNKVLSRAKVIVSPKPKRKITLKPKHNDTSNTDVTSEDEDNEKEREHEEKGSPVEKSSSQIKHNVQKNVQKKICTRSKSDMRRVTRSYSEKISSRNLSRRTTRKTKEAATVYMEILERKLVSPDLENDNISIENFLELPNTRKVPETEIKAKVKQTAVKTISKNKNCKIKFFNNYNKRLDKSKANRLILKKKRLMRVQRYCHEEDSDVESKSSIEISNKRPITRRSLGKVDKPISRNLRSSSKTITVQTVQNNTNNKSKVPIQNSNKFNKEKLAIKRKHDQIVSKSSLDKTNKSKQISFRNNQNENIESEEETLGMLLRKMKKKKDNDKEQERISGNIYDIKDSEVTQTEAQNVKTDSLKVSDDEESFHGFTKKAISKVLNSYQTHANVNLLVTETDKKLNALRTSDASCSRNQEASLQINKIEAATEVCSSINVNLPNQRHLTIYDQKSILDLSKKLKTRNLLASERMDKKCIHENEISLDMPLPTLHMRKERVNMSTEQIEKWLNESSLAKEESKLEMEDMSTFKYDSSDKLKANMSHLSISTKIQHLVRPVNVILPKLADRLNSRERTGVHIGIHKNVTSATTDTQTGEIKLQDLITSSNKIDLNMKEVSKNKNEKSNKANSPLVEDSDTVSKSDQNSIDGFTDKKSPTEKKIFQPRKPFLSKAKERKSAIPNANAFSPENESSVYAFESDTEIPISTPFRRKMKDSVKSTVITSANKIKAVPEISKSNFKDKSEISDCDEKLLHNSDTSVKKKQDIENTTLSMNNFELPKNFTNLTNVQVLPLDKFTSWSNVNCSASIAVQVNLDENTQEQENDINQQKSMEISTQTETNNENDDDNDGQLFYIPLQAVTRNGPNLVQGQQLIQGVAVKLGTEGSTGSNQRVLLRAKLVTKPPLSVVRCPPIGTVQPTTRAPASPTNIVEQQVPSTSTITAVRTTKSNVLNTDTQSTSPVKDQVSVSNSTRQNVNTNGNNSIEKVVKSPKSSGEKKCAVDSTKSSKRAQMKCKQKGSDPLSPSNMVFPNIKNATDEIRLVEAPTFHPSEKDFQDPLEYIDKIKPIAEKFGICRVVPPSNFKPECKVSDDMRFTAYNQYVHRMLHRWGPNVKEMMAIKKYLATQSITLTHPPWIGGMEIDLPHLYQIVQSLGGLKEVIEKKKWQKVADGMKIPKSAQDRVTKLDDIYCKYLLPYDTLSPDEREKLFNQVEAEWMKKETKALQRQEMSSNDNEEEEDDDSSDEIEECIVKGRNMPLNAFYRIARNTQRMWFGENHRAGNEIEGASADEVESAFWKHVAERKRHVCVHAASIDSSGRGFGFSVAKNSPFARHPWNLKVLTNNTGSVLRALGPLMGVTIPTLHVGMLFSACCWYRDPHGLPWIEYLHTGAKKIWYGIPDEYNNNFRKALSKMVPRYCKNKTIWLPSDTAMVPPELLVSNGVPLCQTVQEPGQFIIVFPKAFTSSICTGYVVSESVYFAQQSWLETAEQVFKDIQDSCEPAIFSLERLLFNIINDTRSHTDILKQILPSVMKIREKELNYRKQLENIGLTNKERLPLPDSGKAKKGRKVKEEDTDFECETCRANLFVSLVNNSQDDSIYCLPHALQILNRKKQLLKHCTLMYTYDENELHELIQKLKYRIVIKSKKVNQIKQSK